MAVASEDAIDVVVVEVGVLFEVVMAVLGLTVRVRRVVIAQDDVKRRRQALWVAPPHVMSYGRYAGGQQLSQSRASDMIGNYQSADQDSCKVKIAYIRKQSSPPSPLLSSSAASNSVKAGNSVRGN